MLTNTERQQIVEEVNAGTYGIDEALDDIAEAQKGEEVRKALYAEALVLNREGHAGSTDMIARQKIANLQTSVNGQISTLRTEVGEDIDDLEEALNSGLATQNGKIAAQDATIANVVSNYNIEYGSTELWASTGETGALAAGTTVTLSEDVSHFDYIDIYSFCGNSNVLDTVPVDAKLQSNAGYALRWVNLSDPGSGSYKAYVRIIETRLHIIGTTLTIDHQVTYRNGEEVNISGAEITQSNRSTYMGELGIMKVVGRKITANTEIEDVRIGADGTEYASAGQAVRAQVTALNDAIPAVDDTLSVQGAAADAAAVGSQLARAKSAFVNYVADVVFNGAGWEQGSVNGLNGEDLKSNTVSRTGFLQVTPEKTYTISHNDLNGYILYEFTYNSNCAYIGHLNVTAYNGRRYETNVAFVRFRLEKANSTVTPEIAKGFNIRIYKNDGELFNAIKQTQKLGVMQNFPTDSPATSANAPYNDLDTLPVTSVVVYGLMNGVQHLPDGVTSATIITTNSDNSMSNGAVQLLIDRTNGGILYSRIRAADQWTQWKRALTKSNGVIEFFGNYTYPGGTLSLANAPENATVYVTGDTTYTDKPSFVDSFEGFLTTVVKAVAPQQKYQYFVGRDNGFICYRTYVLGSASWGDWIKVLNQYSLLSATGQNASVGMTQKAITDAINGVIDNTLVNDKVIDATVNIDNISGNHIGYVLNGRNPGELPIDKAGGWLFTFSTVSVRTQIFYTMYQGNTTYTGGTYMRYYSGTSWGPWRRTDSRKYHCGIASFIDDDTSSEEQVQQYASIFREYGLKCGFACVPMPSATHPEYGYIQDNSFQKTMLRLQDDGFSCLLHCYHQSATQPEYILLDEQPADWESAFDKYFKIVGGQYKQLLATESFSANTYYRANTEFYSEAYRGKSVLLTEKPIDWEWNRYEYYTRTYNLVTSENAPLHWGEATYYQNYYTKSGDIYTQLTSWPVGGYTANTYYTAAHSVVSTYPMPEFEQNIYYTPVCWNPYIVQNNMGLTIRTMQKIGLNGWKYWVIPYGETPRDLRRIAKDHGIECAWIMGGTYSDANLKTDRYRINRYTLNAADAVSDYLSGTPTKLNAVKAMIDTVAQNNGWICFCTHINTWRDSRYIGTQVTADQGFNLTKQFVKAVIEYCLEKGVPVESPIRAYEERKDMFDPMESL